MSLQNERSFASLDSLRGCPYVFISYAGDSVI